MGEGTHEDEMIGFPTIEIPSFFFLKNFPLANLGLFFLEPDNPQQI